MSDNSIPGEFYDKYPEPAVKDRLLRIWEQIQKTWGTEEGAHYLESLLIVEDGRTRQGFDSAIMSELLLLEKLHEQAYPEFVVSNWVMISNSRMTKIRQKIFDPGIT